ncbi:MAG: hypothetical protein FWF46_06310 [Oscillospiraceae bacterium]|nr:hypothetical protein [Oscillospiraceae bacterium]
MKNNRGITLIVLIITVIVMLILAGVSIYSVVGQGKLSDLTQTEQNNQKLLTFKQEVQTDLLQTIDIVGTDTNKVFNSLENNSKYSATPNTNAGTLTLTKDGCTAIINNDLTVSVVGYDI